MGTRPARALGFVVAAFIAVAVVACEAPLDRGVTGVGTLNTELFAQTTKAGPVTDYDYYKSQDGGLNWSYVDDVFSAHLKADPVNTPRGDFRISGSEVMLDAPGHKPEIVYSSSHLLQESSRWLQIWKTRHLEGRILTISPEAITYDREHQNILVAMGLQGIVVGRPDGSWVLVEVGPYRPAYYSTPEKLKTLVFSYPLWIAAVTLSLSLIAVASAIATPFWRNRPHENTLATYLGLIGPTAVTSFLASYYLLLQVGNPGSWSNFGASTVAGLPIGKDIMAGLAFLASIWFSGLSLRMSWQGRSKVPRWPLGAALASMMFLFPIPFFLWIILFENLETARLLVFALFAVVSLGLIFWLIRNRENPTTATGNHTGAQE